ncbi:MAG: dihydrolipoyl dehydrogenase [Candidatus Gastranaerophilales bacterium]|nr:dihydrolipoyl dehydrogenase [Candidatus Gastranaerophilales bacterium]
MVIEFDIVFIGSGPAGFTGAIRAAQLGKKVAVIELGFLGGVCLNRGCIPSKSMLHYSPIYADILNTEKFGINLNNPSYDFSKMLELRTQTVDKIRASLEKNMKDNGIVILQGIAKLDKNNKLTVTQESEQVEINYRNLVIATGSSPRMLPNLPEEYILTSDTILTLTELPERTLIIGSGAIGTEWGRILNSLGKKVCIVELADKLAPAMDECVSTALARIFRKQRIEFYTSTSIEKFENNVAKLSNGKEFEFDKILVAVGRTPNNWGLEESNIKTEKGFIKVDENFKTNIDNIYAVGDITGKQMLAHTAAAQSKKLVEHLFLNKKIEINYKNIPAIIYGKPELATVGFTEQDLQKENIEYKSSKLPLTISAKAFIDGEFDGLVKILSIDNKIVGASIVANEASSLLQQLTNAINLGTDIDKLNDIVFAHPTTSEAINEAILNLENKAIYVPQKH